jgi:hypothetical protein
LLTFTEYNKQRLSCKEKNMIKKVACRSNSIPTVLLTSVFLLYHFSDITLFLIFYSSLVSPTCDVLWGPIGHVEADLVGYFGETAEEGWQ